MVSQILVRPIITEKASALIAKNKYVFEVIIDANKIQIKQAIESYYNVQVKEVNTIIVKPRQKNFRTKKVSRIGFTKRLKKAIVTLRSGTIDYLK
ncbi:LSU ribosomal protein L23P [Brevinema andersonii]|uniref:Large ribosomal subunit protein uL23 n=1 Tax=Brevinema andersonii TaxID=34097 RepID=A0A1I1D6Y0_BREAD|nr:50S ribosomal protein L23 [Brevinema andersonii]SFB68333.1 LSU ribosomal protein L23P [Brevinema andersonii]